MLEKYSRRVLYGHFHDLLISPFILESHQNDHLHLKGLGIRLLFHKDTLTVLDTSAIVLSDILTVELPVKDIVPF